MMQTKVIIKKFNRFTLKYYFTIYVKESHPERQNLSELQTCG